MPVPRLLLFFVFAMSYLVLRSAGPGKAAIRANEDLLQRLDSIIAGHDDLVARKESRIDDLRRELYRQESVAGRFALVSRLYDEYLVYDADSAMRQWGNAIWTWDTSMNGNYKWVYGNGPTTIGNPDLSWETMTQWDLGFDARFFNNRFTFGFDYFHKTTDGLLVYGVVPTLSLGGVTSPINAGGVLNEGVEFDLGWQDRIGDFRYSINANVSTLRNKVTKIHPSVPIINGTSFSNVTVTRFEVGEKVWHFYGYDYAGVDAETGRALYWVNRDGQRVTTDAPEESDKTNIGDAIPDVTVGLNINLAYKGFDFNLSGSGQFGNDIYMNLQRQDRLTSNRMYEVFYKNRWTASNPGGTIPAASAINQGTDAERYLFSSAMVQNGSFFKIRQMQLGYTIPRNITRKAFIDNFRVYLSLDDFFTITSYKGLDPEISAGTGSSQGLDMGGYPVTKKFSVGFNVTF